MTTTSGRLFCNHEIQHILKKSKNKKLQGYEIAVYEDAFRAVRYGRTSGFLFSPDGSKQNPGLDQMWWDFF